jgi:hypothetical protein
MTPHLAGHADKTDDLRALALAEMINRMYEGISLHGKVNLEIGY